MANLEDIRNHNSFLDYFMTELHGDGWLSMYTHDELEGLQQLVLGAVMLFLNLPKDNQRVLMHNIRDYINYKAGETC